MQTHKQAQKQTQVAARGGFWAYAAGVAYKLLVEFGVGGLELHNYRTTLPLKKGLSSSAAFCVLVRLAGRQGCEWGWVVGCVGGWGRRLTGG